MDWDITMGYESREKGKEHPGRGSAMVVSLVKLQSVAPGPRKYLDGL